MAAGTPEVEIRVGPIAVRFLGGALHPVVDAADGPPDLGAILDVMRRHGPTPAVGPT